MTTTTLATTTLPRAASLRVLKKALLVRLVFRALGDNLAVLQGILFLVRYKIDLPFLYWIAAYS